MKTKNKIDWRIVCMGLLCLTTVELYALSIGINGTMLAAFVGVVALAIGVTLPNPIK